MKGGDGKGGDVSACFVLHPYCRFVFVLFCVLFSFALWFVLHCSFYFIFLLLFCLVFQPHSRSLSRDACAALREEDLQLQRLSLKEQHQKQQQQQQKELHKQPMLAVQGQTSSNLNRNLVEPSKIMKLRSSGYGPKPSTSTSTIAKAAVPVGKSLVTSFPTALRASKREQQQQNLRQSNNLRSPHALSHPLAFPFQALHAI